MTAPAPPARTSWNGLVACGEMTRPDTGPALHVLRAQRGTWPAGRAALMVHSLTSHAHAWLPVISRMTAGRFVCPDLRGHGFSDWTREGYWLADYARDLAGLCATLPADQIDLVAPSLGARVVMLLAPMLGDRLRSVVILDGAPSISAQAAAKVAAIRTATGTRTAFRDEQQVIDFWTAAHPGWDAEAHVVRARYLYRRNWAGLLVSVNDPEIGHLFGRAALAEQDALWAALRATPAPATVVRGRDSYLTDEATARAMTDALPGGRYLEVDGGHYLAYENSPRLAALLDDLLALPTKEQAVYTRTDIYIDGAWVPAHDSGTIAVENPATQTVIGEIPACDAKDVDRAALAAGCTVVAKPSEITPFSCYLLFDAIEASGLPPGVLNLVTGEGPTVGESLVLHPGVDMVSLTGSTRAGRRVLALAAPDLKKVTLELGGKSASLILDERTRLGPLVSAVQRERVRGFIDAAPGTGARLVTGGSAAPDGFERGYYVRPTVFADVDPSSPLGQQEVFGPVLAITPVTSDEDAVRIANDSKYGLAGAVWSQDEDRAVAVARRIETGSVDVNGGRYNPLAPFGGVKHSGIGREMGRYGLQEYLEPKAVQL